MSAPSQADGVRALAEPLAREAGLVIENVTITPAGKRRVLRVIVDLPEELTGGVPMDAVSNAAQAISAALDASPVMGATPYVLEVSSPGADRPLTERRHWMRARGRLVQLTAPQGRAPAWPSDGSIGRLTAVTEAGLILDGDREVAWTEIGSGRVELEFGRPAEFDHGAAADDPGDDDPGDDDPDDDPGDDPDDDLDDDEIEFETDTEHNDTEGEG